MNLLKDKIEEYKRNEDFILEGLILEITEMVSLVIRDRGWSKKDIAKKMGVSQAWVTKFLNGHNNFTLKTIVRICNILNIDLSVNYLKDENKVDLIAIQKFETSVQSLWSDFFCPDIENEEFNLAKYQYGFVGGSISPVTDVQVIQSIQCDQLN